MAKESNVDVLIIGAGPAGVMAANAFAKAGVNVKIVDKRPKKVAAGQADGIQPRTIEVFQSYGLADRLLREGNQMQMAAFYNPAPSGGIMRDGRAPDVTAPTARWPFELTLHQGAIEAILLDSMRSYGLEIDRPLQPTEIVLDDSEEALASADSYPVKVTLQHVDPKPTQQETEVVNAKYVIGADGAHSWVRKQLGFTMDGEQTEYVWGVVDMIPTTDFPDIRNRTAIHSNYGSCMIIPREGDIVRLYIQLSDEDAREVLNTNGRIDKMLWTPQRLMEIARRCFKPYTIEFPTNTHLNIRFKLVGQRVASNFSKKERIFIAGDACHTHSPKAGQGMNASMNDSHNLVWKITHVLRGWADPSILKTYELERRKYAQDLIDFDRKFSALFSGKPRTEENHDGVSHEEFLAAFQTFGGFTSGIGIQYSPSPITNLAHQALATNLSIGARMPPQTILCAADARPFELQDLLPSDSRFKVVVFTGNLDAETQRAKVDLFAKEAAGEGGFLLKYGVRTGAEKGWASVFEVLTVLVGTKETVNYTSVPAVLRSHWTKVFVDDLEVKGINGGTAYSSYGIPPEGAVVIVRPDGYVGMIAPLEGAKALDDYFASFMKPS
ncbi:FAD binding domain-containing protein [Phellopilus nigrolimitatus]|nr:FAD binding domain-containing protein [Phellopilus nigrolimitatus]